MHEYESVHEHGNRHGERGMSLLEMLGYVAVLAVLFNVAAGAFLACSRLSAKGTTALDRSEAVEEIRAEFTEAVRGGSRIVPGVCSFRTGPEQVVLEMPSNHEEPNVKRYTVLGFLGKEARVSRMRISERYGNAPAEPIDTASVPAELVEEALASLLQRPGGPSSVELEGSDTYRLPVESVQFTYGAAELVDSRLVTVALDIKDDRPQGGKSVVHRFSASLRGVAGANSGGAP
jgi:hypothetical protein